MDNEGKWGSFSLKELHKMGNGGIALYWIFQKINENKPIMKLMDFTLAIGLKEIDEISLEHLKKGVEFLSPDSYAILKNNE